MRAAASHKWTCLSSSLLELFRSCAPRWFWPSLLIPLPFFPPLVSNRLCFLWFACCVCLCGHADEQQASAASLLGTWGCAPVEWRRRADVAAAAAITMLGHGRLCASACTCILARALFFLFAYDVQRPFCFAFRHSVAFNPHEKKNSTCNNFGSLHVSLLLLPLFLPGGDRTTTPADSEERRLCGLLRERGQHAGAEGGQG